MPNDTEIAFLDELSMAKKKKVEAKKRGQKKDARKTILGLGKLMHVKAQESSKARKKKAAEEAAEEAKAKQALKRKKIMLASLEKHQQEEREAKIRGMVSEYVDEKAISACEFRRNVRYMELFLWGHIRPLNRWRHSKKTNTELRDRQDCHRYHWVIQSCVTVYRNPWFHTGMLGLITLNVIILALDQFPSLNRETMEVPAFSCFF